MIHGVIDFILGGSTAFERYSANVRSSNVSGLLTADEARKDFQAMQYNRMLYTLPY